MDNNLITTDSNENTRTIDSREVAEMMETKHYKILEKLEGTKDGKTKGIIPILTDHEIVVSDYFIESTYKDSTGKENKCYLCTKMGCEFLANKFTGEKGILFSAKYVKRFNDMEQQIQKSVLSFQIEDPIERAKAWIREQEESRQLIAQKDEIIEELSPFAKIARERMDNTGTISFTDVTESYKLKRGQFSCWAKIKGYINRSGNSEVNQSGKDYFKTIVDKQGFKNVAIKEEGLKLVDKFIDEIKETPCRFNMKLVQE